MTASNASLELEASNHGYRVLEQVAFMLLMALPSSPLQASTEETQAGRGGTWECVYMYMAGSTHGHMCTLLSAPWPLSTVAQVNHVKHGEFKIHVCYHVITSSSYTPKAWVQVTEGPYGFIQRNYVVCSLHRAVTAAPDDRA